ncbi:MAG TPA: hypothetical protein VH307_02135 [Streptosporangiaceae bacterium]|jgi:hypothetical protein|nr:hypothetical protein [Streptosporangiaceae bacterium]
MRDPEMILRAQQAAAELERAWDRWRTMHGLGIDPPPPVSSYVGYSLEEPWGQPRVVFGIDAREAEQLAALLDRHDCAGPVYASVASLSAARTGDATDARAAEADRHRAAGRVRVPTQAQPSAAQRERLPEPTQPEALRGPVEPPARRDSRPRNEEPGPGAAGTQAQEPPSADDEASALREDQDAEAMQPAPPAFIPRLEPAVYPDEDQEPGPVLDEPGQTAEPGRAAAGWTRANRGSGGHALPRQKRPARGAGSKQEGRDRSRREAMAADLAGWTAGELPGQASRC